MGIFHLKMYEDWQYYIKMWITYLTQGYDPRIDTYGSMGLSTVINQTLTDQLTHAVVGGRVIGGIQVLTYYRAPWVNGFVFNTPGLTNYRGFIESAPIVRSEHILYS